VWLVRQRLVSRDARFGNVGADSLSLSLCTIALNEQQFLAGMLETVRNVVDDVVIGIDSRTTDQTEQIATAHGARTFAFDWHDSFADARNLTIDQARGDWIVVIDPDERLLPAGRAALLALMMRVDTIPLEVDGFHTLIVETTLDDVPLSPPERSSSRLFRNVPDLRYMGRVHEEVRYLPDPPRTYCDLLEGGPHIQHYGLDQSVWQQRDKAKRDRCLLHLRLRDNPDDAVAYCYLALMARKDGRPIAARTFARRALECGPRTLHDDRREQLLALLDS
jgi:glycosyltransferase involved in cell wall biosynthesis